MSQPLDLSVIIPALNEGPNLALLLPRLRRVLDDLKVRYEIFIVTKDPDDETISVASQFGAEVVEQRERGYGGALITGVERARAPYLLTMDADLSHRPFFIRDLWSRRHLAEVTIASRYIAGGSARMPITRYLLSRVLNALFRIGLSLPIHDMSSGFRLYKADVLADMIKAGGQGHAHQKDEYQERYETSGIRARDFDILQEILVRAYADGWKIAEVPFKYTPRKHGSSHARILRFGRAYLRSFWPLWQMRNSVLSADYDDRAYNSRIFLQRYWQRSRFRHITELIAGRGPVLDVGCGSSRIIGALPPGSVALDLLPHKLRYARKFSKPLVQASGFHLPFPDESFPCVVCSQVIEHVPMDSPMLDELCRVLERGGRLVLGTPDYGNWQWVVIEKLYGFFARGGYAEEHITQYTRRDLVKMFEKRGFSLEATRYILQGELILAFRKGSKRVAQTAKELVAARSS